MAEPHTIAMPAWAYNNNACHFHCHWLWIIDGFSFFWRQRATDADLVHDQLFNEAGAVVARSGHPLASRRSVAPLDLLAQSFILARRRELERVAFDDLFRAHELEPPEPVIESTSTVLMKAVVMQSDMLTFIPRELMWWEEQAGQLVALNVSGSPWVRRVGITRRRRGSLSPAARLLIEALRRSAQALAPAGA